MSLSKSRLQQLYLQYNSRHKHITGRNKLPVSIRVCIRIAKVYTMQACINIRLSNTQDCSFSMMYSFWLSTVWNGYGNMIPINTWLHGAQSKAWKDTGIFLWLHMFSAIVACNLSQFNQDISLHHKQMCLYQQLNCISNTHI